jgi:hypothetical protein
MLFTSLEFFAFLPLALLVFWALPIGHRWAWLLLASWLFYGLWHPANLVYLGAVTVLVWACGRAMAGERRGRAAWLTAGLVLVLGSLLALARTAADRLGSVQEGGDRRTIRSGSARRPLNTCGRNAVAR